MLILAIERPIPGVADAQFTPDLSAAEARRAWELHTRPARSGTSTSEPTNRPPCSCWNAATS
jgi:hypothetical protein